jgi:AraC-like DNA-binding protein
MEATRAPTALRAPSRLAFATDDPAEAHAHARRMMADHRMRLTSRSARFAAEVHHARLGGVRLLHFTYNAPVRIWSAPLRDFATVHLPLSGGLEVDHNGARVSAHPGRGVVFSPCGDVAMDWTTGLRLLVIRIERETLEERLRALVPGPLREPLRFAPELDARTTGRALLGALASAHAALAGAGPEGPPPLLAAELERSIATALLVNQPHTYSEAMRTWPRQPAADVVDAALERAAATPGDPPTAAELADATGVSERTLHDAFHRRFGTSPIAYVRGLRMEAARRALQAADPASGVTVARIALEHGFAHPGRFAVTYRERFGESPAATLRG